MEVPQKEAPLLKATERVSLLEYQVHLESAVPWKEAQAMAAPWSKELGPVKWLAQLVQEKLLEVVALEREDWWEAPSQKELALAKR